MLFNRAVDFETKHPLIGTHLKLLYTGITRCIERLFIVETSGSIPGNATVRFLTTTSVKRLGDSKGALASRNQVNDIKATVMTSDEFLSQGFSSAEISDSDEVD